MAKIINKEVKKYEIAEASIKLFIHKEINKISIDEIAKYAGVAKGTIYLYFKNKEEIIFTIWELLSKNHLKILESNIDIHMSAQQKILKIFNFSLYDKKYTKREISTLYQNFLGVILLDKQETYTPVLEKIFKKNYDVIIQYLQEGINNGEFISFDCITVANILLMIFEGGLIKSKKNNMSYCQMQCYLNLHILHLITLYQNNEKKEKLLCIDPFANEEDVIHIDELDIENRLDRISIHGSVDITKDQQG